MDWPSPSSLSVPNRRIRTGANGENGEKSEFLSFSVFSVASCSINVTTSPRRDLPRFHEVIGQDRPRQQIGDQHQGAEQDSGPHADVESLTHVTGPVEAIDIGENVE